MPKQLQLIQQLPTVLQMQAKQIVSYLLLNLILVKLDMDLGYGMFNI